MRATQVRSYAMIAEKTAEHGGDGSRPSSGMRFRQSVGNLQADALVRPGSVEVIAVVFGNATSFGAVVLGVEGVETPTGTESHCFTTGQQVLRNAVPL